MSTAPTTRLGPPAEHTGGALIELRDVTVEYLTDRGAVPACRDVSLSVHRGEILGIAGESGSGKSTLLTAIARLQRPPAVTTGGQILFRPGDGPAVDLVRADERTMTQLRWTEISLVMQSAMDCLNPVMRLGAQFVDVIRTHDRTISRAAAENVTGDMLKMVGIPPDRAGSYPHEMSGGMRQRALIALALVCNPSLVLMDEPTTAVDVVMQRQILAQLIRLQQELSFAVVFVTHDLSLLLELADRIAVMYAGRIVEIGPAGALYESPRHPYSTGLRDAFPPLREPVRTMSGIPGTPPDLRSLPSGCSFRPRCAHAFDDCSHRVPLLQDAGDQRVACHLYDEPAGGAS